MKLSFFVMPQIGALLLAMMLAFSCDAASDEKGGFQVRKNPELQQIKPKKPVKIKLKRTAKDEYSWELSGDDADEVIRVDKKLRRFLNGK